MTIHNVNPSTMKIVVAPDSFKGTLSARRAATAMSAGLRRILPDAEIVNVPLADGGEGTLDVIVSARNGNRQQVVARDPLGGEARAEYGLIDDETCAVVEMAQASGLLLVPPHRRNIMRASTFGTGQLTRHAFERGVRRMLVAVGGSATCDGGCGMAQALGVRFYRADGSLLSDGLGGGDLAEVDRVDADAMPTAFRATSVEILCDVRNPLVGPDGAAHVYGPQKGATPEQVETLDANLAHLARLMERDLGIRVADMIGGGAAGGLAAGLVAFVGGRICSGIETVMEAVQLAEHSTGATALLTGEGRLDQQSLQGKVASGVAALGKRLGVPVFALAGQVDLDRPAWAETFADVAAVTAVSNGPAAQDPTAALADAAAACAGKWFISS
jgi:glycerate kinase